MAQACRTALTIAEARCVASFKTLTLEASLKLNCWMDRREMVMMSRKVEARSRANKLASG